MFKRLGLLALFATLTLSARAASALTTINPPASWNGAPVTILVGKFAQWPNAWVIYRNANTGACGGWALPNSGAPSYAITDDIVINGSNNADVVRVNRTGSVFCNLSGITYTLDTSGPNGGPLAGFLNARRLDVRGLGGADNMESSLGFPSSLFGDDGNDTLLGSEEETQLIGGNGADKLKADNSLLIGGSDRILSGGNDDDCIQDHTSGGGGGKTTRIDCGAGSDEKTTHGVVCTPSVTVMCQIVTNCEVTTRTTACF